MAEFFSKTDFSVTCAESSDYYSDIDFKMDNGFTRLFTFTSKIILKLLSQIIG